VGASFAQGEGIIAGVLALICIVADVDDSDEGVFDDNKRSNNMLESVWDSVMAGMDDAGVGIQQQ
jgi:hypothetical protein